MNISNTLLTLSQAAEIEQPSLFPFPFKIHVIFSCLAVIFFAFQFIREKKPYQLILGIAIPFSLVIWLSENRTLFYAIGIIEAVLLLSAFITTFIFKDKNNTVAKNEVKTPKEITEPENNIQSDEKNKDEE